MSQQSHHPQKYSRRAFLGLSGLAAIVSGITCGGGMLGYLALQRLADSDAPQDAPTIAPQPDSTATTRPARLKQIERPPITSRAGWNARPVNTAATNEHGLYSPENPEGWREYTGDLRAIYRTVIVHHSVLIEADDPATMREIQNQHMDLRGWADIGYHFGVGRNGQVFEGRGLQVRGTHVERFNTGSVGVVFFGNFEITPPTAQQLETGRSLINWLALRLELTHLAGHLDFNDFTECPGLHMLPHLPAFALAAGLSLGTDGYQPSEEQQATPPPV